MNQAPYRTPVQDENGQVKQPWRNFFESLFSVAFAVRQSGTTAQRPTVGLWIGRPYFDTTLGYIIHHDGTNWVNSAGTTV